MSGSSRSGFSVVISAEDRATRTIDRVNRKIAEMRAPADRATRSLAKLGDTTGISALARGMRDVAQHSLEAFNNVARLAPGVAALTGAGAIAGLAKLSSEFAEFGSKLGFSAQRAGLTASRLQELQGAARLAGSSAEALTGGITALNDNLTNAAAGRAPEAVLAFQYLGIALRGADGHLRTVTEVLPELADKLAGIHNPALQAQLATMLLGGAAESLLPVLRGGSAALAENTEKLRRYGVLNEEGVAAANRLRIAQAELSLASESLAHSIGQALEPAITPMLHDMAEWIARNRELTAQDVAGWARETAPWIRGVAVVANDVAQAIGGWKTVGEDVVLWWSAKLLGPLSPIARTILVVNELKRALEELSGGLEKIIFGEQRALSTKRFSEIGPFPTREQIKWAMEGTPGPMPPPGGQGAPTVQGPSQPLPSSWPILPVTPATPAEQRRQSAPGVGPVPPVGMPAPNPNHWGAPPAGTPAPAGTAPPAGNATPASTPPPAGAIPPAAAGDAARQATIRDMLARDLQITPAAASGIVSNLQAESGLQGINERNPTIPGSRGGFGWAQWTGPRRDAFESYAAANHLNPSSDEANYGFLVQELRQQYPQVLAQLRAGQITAAQAANTFFTGYESGGAPQLEPVRGQHVAGAERIAALPSSGAPAPPVGAPPTPPAPPPLPTHFAPVAPAGAPAAAPLSPPMQVAAAEPPWWTRPQFGPSMAAAERSTNRDRAEQPPAGTSLERFPTEEPPLSLEKTGETALALKGLTQRLQTPGAIAGSRYLREQEEAERRNFLEQMHRWHYAAPETAQPPIAGVAPPAGTSEPTQPGTTPAPETTRPSPDIRGGAGPFQTPIVLPSAPPAPTIVLPAPAVHGIGDGTGASPFQSEAKITGGADLNINLTGFPQGTKTSAKTTGNAFLGAPRVETALPYGMA